MHKYIINKQKFCWLSDGRWDANQNHIFTPHINFPKIYLILSEKFKQNFHVLEVVKICGLYERTIEVLKFGMSGGNYMLQ